MNLTDKAGSALEVDAVASSELVAISGDSVLRGRCIDYFL